VPEHEMVSVRRDDLELLRKVCACYVPYPPTDDISETMQRTLAALAGPDATQPAAPEPPLLEGGQWAVVELLGHRRRAGYVTEVTVCGTAMLRITLPAAVWGGDPQAWEQYTAAAMYGMHPASEAEVRGAWERDMEARRRAQEWQASRAALLPGDDDPDEDLDDDDDDDEPLRWRD
jgi:hypothetical protein